MASGPGPGWPQSGFLFRGMVRVTPAALDLARAFAEKMQASQPGEDRVVSFNWADMRRLRLHGNTWADVGPSLALGTWPRAEVPAECIEVVDGLAFAIWIPEPTRSAARERRIDRDDSVPTKLTLR